MQDWRQPKLGSFIANLAVTVVLAELGAISVQVGSAFVHSDSSKGDRPPQATKAASRSTSYGSTVSCANSLHGIGGVEPSEKR